MISRRNISGEIVFLVILMAIVLIAYIVKFGVYTSSCQEQWGQFGDYIGGILNPIIAFFVFYYVIKNYLAQQEYFKKQEFENNFFRLYDEFKQKSENFDFSKLTSIVDSNGIVDFEQYKKRFAADEQYPIVYFNFLKLLLNKIDRSDLEATIKMDYVEIIKLNIDPIQLAFVALHDMMTENEIFHQQLKKYQFFEYFDTNHDQVYLLILLKNYDLLGKKMSIHTEAKDVE